MCFFAIPIIWQSDILGSENGLWPRARASCIRKAAGKGARGSSGSRFRTETYSRLLGMNLYMRTVFASPACLASEIDDSPDKPMKIIKRLVVIHAHHEAIPCSLRNGIVFLQPVPRLRTVDFIFRDDVAVHDTPHVISGGQTSVESFRGGNARNGASRVGRGGKQVGQDSRV